MEVSDLRKISSSIWLYWLHQESTQTKSNYRKKNGAVPCTIVFPGLSTSRPGSTKLPKTGSLLHISMPTTRENSVHVGWPASSDYAI